LKELAMLADRPPCAPAVRPTSWKGLIVLAVAALVAGVTGCGTRAPKDNIVHPKAGQTAPKLPGSQDGKEKPVQNL
jgi:hypothetical protein